MIDPDTFVKSVSEMLCKGFDVLVHEKKLPAGESLKMSISAEEFILFTDFGRSLINSGKSSMSLDDLVIEWESYKHRDHINEAIREGIAGADSGRHRPAAEAMADLRQKHGLTSNELPCRPDAPCRSGRLDNTSINHSAFSPRGCDLGRPL